MTDSTRRETRHRGAGAISLFLGAVLSLAAPIARAQSDQMYFPAIDDVTSVLVSKINAETVRIDMSAWYLSEHAISIALVNAFHRGVQIRLIGDRGSIFEIDPQTKSQFYWLASQGVPIRLRYNPSWFPEIDHWKATVFKGQRLVAFGSANYTPSQLAPSSSTNYSDETVLATTDPPIVNAFLTKFDTIWNDTTLEPSSRIPAPPYLKNWNDACAIESACLDYRSLYPNPAPMVIDTARLEPNSPMPTDLIWGQGPAFNNRLVQEINNEFSSIKFVIYRLTVDNITQALLNKFQAGVPVELIVEPGEYLNRKWPEFWLTHANIDRLWAAGVPIKERQHQGLTHMKMLVTSRYATNASSNYAASWQRDHDYFVSASGKPTIYQAMVNRFDTMWNDTVGFASFHPEPPDPPTPAMPVMGAAGISQIPTLTWNASPFATSYGVYLGVSPDSLALVANVAAQMVANPPTTYSWQPTSPLATGTTYFWKIVARTNATVRDASLVASSSSWFFTTGGTPGGGSTPTQAGRNSDFDGNGCSDLLWHDNATGRSVLWLMASVTRLQERAVTTVSDPEWRIAAIGDMNGDGRPDLIWRHAITGEDVIWFMAGATKIGEASIERVPDPRWRIVGVGDVNGDGRLDIFWRHDITGQNVVWLMNGTAKVGEVSLPTVSEPSWKVVAVADFNGDGRPDLVWRNSVTALNVVWYLRGGELLSWARLPSVSDLNWEIAMAGDFNQDGRPDLLWRNTATGQNTVWFLSDTRLLGVAALSAVGTEWTLAPSLPQR